MPLPVNKSYSGIDMIASAFRANRFIAKMRPLSVNDINLIASAFPSNRVIDTSSFRQWAASVQSRIGGILLGYYAVTSVEFFADSRVRGWEDKFAELCNVFAAGSVHAPLDTTRSFEEVELEFKFVKYAFGSLSKRYNIADTIDDATLDEANRITAELEQIIRTLSARFRDFLHAWLQECKAKVAKQVCDHIPTTSQAWDCYRTSKTQLEHDLAYVQGTLALRARSTARPDSHQAPDGARATVSRDTGTEVLSRTQRQTPDPRSNTRDNSISVANQLFAQDVDMTDASSEDETLVDSSDESQSVGDGGQERQPDPAQIFFHQIYDDEVADLIMIPVGEEDQMSLDSESGNQIESPSFQSAGERADLVELGIREGSIQVAEPRRVASPSSHDAGPTEPLLRVGRVGGEVDSLRRLVAIDNNGNNHADDRVANPEHSDGQGHSHIDHQQQEQQHSSNQYHHHYHYHHHHHVHHSTGGGDDDSVSRIRRLAIEE